MTTESRNDKSVDVTSPGGTPQRRHNGAARPSQLNGDEAIKNSAGIHRQKLAAAQREIEALAKLNNLLREKAALLSDCLANTRRFAYHDELTGLPNRRLLHDHFDMAVARAKRQHGRVVVLFVDLDNFKSINDTFGHLAADRVLQRAATRLTESIRASDTVCRYGGDEIVILLSDIETPEDAIATAEKIRASLTTPYDIDGVPIRATASIGMATWPCDGKDCRALIKSADAAMYLEKKHPDVGNGLPATSVPIGLEHAISEWRKADLVTG